MACLKHTIMTSAVDPSKVRALLKESQTSGADGEGDADNEVDDEETPEDDVEKKDADVEEDLEDEDGDEDGDDELTVESLTESLAPAVATINEIVDEFRGGGDAQPRAGIESLEEMEELGAELVHRFCEWADEAGKKEFRALGDALELEDVDGFVGWCRAVSRVQEEGGFETSSDADDEQAEDETDVDDGEGNGEDDQSDEGE